MKSAFNLGIGNRCNHHLAGTSHRSVRVKRKTGFNLVKFT
jgi:hypothetical protein